MLPFVGHTKGVRAVAFAPDGRTLISGGADGRAIVWDRRSARELHSIQTHLAPVRTLACHPDGGRFACAFRSYPNVLGAADRIRLWSIGTGRVVHHEPPADPGYWQRAAAAVAGAEPQEIVLPVWAALVGLHFARDGGVVALLTDRDPEREYAVRGHVVGFAAAPPYPRLPPTWLQRRSRVEALTFSADGLTAAVASDKWVRVGPVDAASVSPGYAARGPVHSLALTPDGSRLLGCWGRFVTAWDTAGAGELREFAGHTEPVEAVAAHPGGSLIASASLDGTVMLWHLDSGGVQARYDWGLGPVHALAFDPDGLTLAVAGDGGLAVIDVE